MIGQSAYNRLPTPAKMLLLLSLALLPIGGGLMWMSIHGIRDAGNELRTIADDETRRISDSISALIARNALALRLAANAALSNGAGRDCDEASQTLRVAPGVASRFEIENTAGTPLCAVGDFSDLDRPPIAAPGEIRLWIAADQQSLLLRTGVEGGSATTRLTLDDLRRTAESSARSVAGVTLEDGQLEMTVLDRPRSKAATASEMKRSSTALGNGDVRADIAIAIPSITPLERIAIFLPLLMWALAALVSWFLVSRLLIRPLRQLERSVGAFEPGGDSELVLPTDLGPATEIRALGAAFARAVQRIEDSERQMGEALEGQRRLVREVHHRVKNNLQVVASLLSIHGRMAEGPDAKAAYSAIGRRVDALAVVHRNHFAELEENQGIALRPMLSELSTGLRSSAPEPARGLAIELDVEHASTTQDAAVAVAFLVTEVVEYSMLDDPPAQVDIFLRRTSELTARLTLVSRSLLEDAEPSASRRQFDRIVEGLARQLRSPLDHKLGRYSVDLPVFPAN